MRERIYSRCLTTLGVCVVLLCVTWSNAADPWTVKSWQEWQRKRPKPEYNKYTELHPELVGYDSNVHIHIHNRAEADTVRKKVVD